MKIKNTSVDEFTQKLNQKIEEAVAAAFRNHTGRDFNPEEDLEHIQVERRVGDWLIYHYRGEDFIGIRAGTTQNLVESKIEYVVQTDRPIHTISVGGEDVQD